jgi:hypothetical protein
MNLYNKKVIVLAIVVTHLAARSAYGQDAVPLQNPPPPPLTAPLLPGTGFLHLRSGSHVVTDGGTDLRLPPGYYLDDPTWIRLDGEFRRLQDQETRLTAQNEALRKSTSGWQPGWKTLTATLIVGLAGGVYLSSKL